MNELKCGVLNCISNCGNRCMRTEIHVSGKNAKTKSDTCCQSFSESRGGFQNSLYGTADLETEISCDAETCAYNSDRRCSARNVTVCGGGSGDCKCTSCGTFKPEKR
ncbi:MAG: DUF1540 domain-containing protein [Clostridia bacterium]|nr:DUF1540 domain-containing protein [Clostridia bacterium]